MANKKISQYTLENFNTNQEFVVNSNGTTKKVKSSSIRSNIRTGLATSAQLTSEVSTLNTTINNKIDPGWIATKGLYMDGTDLKLYPYKMNVNGTIYENASASTVVDVSGLAASTWYAVGVKETDGTIDDIAFGGFDNWAIVGNQLDALSIYDENYNYMRDSVSGVWYRIIGIFKVNAGQTDCDYILNTPNKPKTFVMAGSDAEQTITNNTIEVVDFEDIEVDINSEVTVGAAWKWTAKTAQTGLISGRVRFASSANWEVNEISSGYVYKNGAIRRECDRTEREATRTAQVTVTCNAVPYSAKVGDYFDIRVFQNTDFDLALQDDAEKVWCYIEEQ